MVACTRRPLQLLAAISIRLQQPSPSECCSKGRTMRGALAIGAITLSMLSCHAGNAASLRVAPTNLELVAPDSAPTLTLRNEDTRPINVQIRVLHWTQIDGIERLDPTTDV